MQDIVRHLVTVCQCETAGQRHGISFDLALLLPVSALTNRWFAKLPLSTDALRFVSWRPDYTGAGGTAPQRFASVWCVWTADPFATKLGWYLR